MITADELRQMRADVEAIALPDTCNILTVSSVTDGQGGVTQTWGTAESYVACRLDAVANLNTTATGKEMSLSGAVQDFSRWILTLPYDTTINEAYRVEKGTDTYNVVFVDNNQSWPVTRRVIVEKV